ncbi:hypothetical protein LJR246_002405 [Mesorhizobium sp. LjRoot246]
MMPAFPAATPAYRGKPCRWVQKENGSGSLGLTEPFHRNFPEYSNLHGFFTPKNRFFKNLPLFSRTPSRQMRIGVASNKKSGRDRSRPD